MVIERIDGVLFSLRLKDTGVIGSTLGKYNLISGPILLIMPLNLWYRALVTPLTPPFLLLLIFNYNRELYTRQCPLRVAYLGTLL